MCTPSRTHSREHWQPATTYTRQPATEPMVTHFGFSAFSRNSLVAWYSRTTPKTFGTRCACKSAIFRSLTDGKIVAMAALAMTKSRWLIPCFSSSLTASEGSLSTEASHLTTISLLPFPVGSSERLFEDGCEGSRLSAITVCEGLAK